MKILVADDSRAMRALVVRTLRQAGYAGHEIIEARDGQETLALFHRESPDLVLSNWNMPAPDGLEVLEAVRRSGSRVPFGLVTAEGSEPMRARAEASGATFVVAKPFTTESLESALQPILG